MNYFKRRKMYRQAYQVAFRLLDEIADPAVQRARMNRLLRDIDEIEG